MNKSKYTYLLIFISITIASTLLAQLYWNYNNFLQNKQRITNEIQLSLDNALEEYYADLAKDTYISIVEKDSLKSDDFFKNIPFDSIFSEINPTFFTSKKVKKSIPINGKLKKYTFIFKDSTLPSSVTLNVSNTTETRKEQKTAQIKVKKFGGFQQTDKISHIQIFRGQRIADSINLVKGLNKIIISFQQDTIVYSQVDSLLNIQLNQRNIPLDFQLHHFKNERLIYPLENIVTHSLFVPSKSTFLKKDEAFNLYFKNPFKETIKRSFIGILLSLLLSLTIISCLFYLLHIIKNQKQLSEIKNDLISNITHEFKTPIATISVALEGLQNFGGLDNPQKTKLYLDTSTQQLSKLQLMVEKLLETAALDNSEYELDLQNLNLSRLIEKVVQRQQHLHINHQFKLHISDANIHYNIDEFHFENAINNLLDNAVKYGKSQVFINLKQEKNAIVLSISDDGNGMENKHKNKVFEQFYRIPTGNTHTIKGFGIGLYYCKSIIEKTGGTIRNEGSKNNKFIITLPHEQH